RAGFPQLGAASDPGSESGYLVRRMSQPWISRIMALGHRPHDQLGQHVVLAVEVEVEGASRYPGRAQDVSDGEVAERLIRQETGGRRKYPFAQVRAADQ